MNISWYAPRPRPFLTHTVTDKERPERRLILKFHLLEERDDAAVINTRCAKASNICKDGGGGMNFPKNDALMTGPVVSFNQIHPEDNRFPRPHARITKK